LERAQEKSRAKAKTRARAEREYIWPPFPTCCVGTPINGIGAGAKSNPTKGKSFTAEPLGRGYDARGTWRKAQVEFMPLRSCRCR